MRFSISSIQQQWARTQFNTKMRLNLYARIQKMTSGGLPMLKVLDDLYQRASNQGKKPNDITAIVLADWKGMMQNGRRFSEALKGWAPDFEVMLISTGEDAGELNSALTTVIEFTKARGEIRGVIVGGVAYPTLVLLMAFAYIYIFGVHVIPKFAAVVDPSRWTGAARSLYLMSGFVQQWWTYTLIGIVAFIVCIGISLPAWKGKSRVILDSIPPYSIYRLLVGSGFLMSLSALIGGGIPVDRALAKLSELASPWLRERIDATLIGLKSGHNLGEAMKRSGYRFPSEEIIDDLCVYAEYGGFSVAIKRVADDWLADGVTSVSASMKVLNTGSIFFLAGVVMWLVAGFFGIQQEISNLVRSAS